MRPRGLEKHDSIGAQYEIAHSTSRPWPGVASIGSEIRVAIVRPAVRLLLMM
jgi:hypothetical protein